MAKTKTNQEYSRIFHYLVTGGAWFWSGYAMFAFLYSIVGMGVVESKVFSYVFGLSVNFVLERFWVFTAKEATKQLDSVTVKYLVLSGVNLFIDTFIVWSLSQLGVSPYIGQFVSAGFFTIWNYIWYKLWVFAKQASPGPKRPAAPALKRPKHVQYYKTKAA